MKAEAGGWFERARAFLAVGLWSAEPEKLSQLRVVRLLQFFIMVGQGFVGDKLLLRASGLAYFTVISIVPVLAVAVSIASAVGIGGVDFADWVVGAIAAGSPRAVEYIRPLIEGANFAGLGTIGAATLFVTTVLAIGNVESALNGIWGVTEGRSYSRRFSDYLAVIVVGPLLGGVALSLMATLNSELAISRLTVLPGFTRLYDFGLRHAPTVVLSLAFSFLYAFLPNTKVRVRSALLGGILAGVLVANAQRVYVDFSVGAARADAFFGGFALLPLLLAWIYILWAIILFGAEIAFAHQNLHLYRDEVQREPAGAAEREAIGLRIALGVARRFRDGAPGLDAGALAESLRVPVRTVRGICGRLLDAGVLAVQRLEDEREAFLLGRPADRIAVVDVLAALRGGREPLRGDPALSQHVESVLAELDESAAKGAASRTLADLLGELPAEVDPQPAQG